MIGVGVRPDMYGLGMDNRGGVRLGKVGRGRVR